VIRTVRSRVLMASPGDAVAADGTAGRAAAAARAVSGSQSSIVEWNRISGLFEGWALDSGAGARVGSVGI
jgi:hypothetical protein